MSNIYNIYCDESCHLENDKQPIMLIAGVWCPKTEVKNISHDITTLQKKHNACGEIKWTKLSPSRLDFFKEIIEYFFNNSNLHYRCLVVNNKERLDHALFNQGSHDLFYYKMYFSMLKAILSPEYKYNIYLDIKDTRSYNKIIQLKEVLCNNQFDFTGQMIENIGQIRSEESSIMQIADLLTGAVGYINRNLSTSKAKQTIVELVKARSGFSLNHPTSLREAKFNLFFFSPSISGASCV